MGIDSLAALRRATGQAIGSARGRAGTAGIAAGLRRNARSADRPLALLGLT